MSGIENRSGKAPQFLASVVDQEAFDKAILLAKKGASKDDLIDLQSVVSLLPLRGVALEDSARRLKDLEKLGMKLTSDRLFALASTDLFVEKAQLVLTRRSDKLFLSGTLTIISTFLILLTAALFIAWQLKKPIDENVMRSVNALILRVFQATALSAFALVAVKYLVALARSFFHEATSLRERRHALRFGRLYVYLKRGEVDVELLQEAFQWNKETRTSFLDMKPEVVAETLLHKIVEVFTKTPPEVMKIAVDTFGKYVQSSIDKKKSDKA
jgi:hypothetical protein